MAKLENGYSRVANELLEGLTKAGLSSSEYAVMLVVIRHTYGWQRTLAPISSSFLAKATGISERTVKYARQNLKAKKMIVFGPRSSETEIAVIGPNPDVEKWLVNARSPAYRNKLKRDRLQRRATGERPPTSERQHTNSSERTIIKTRERTHTQKRNRNKDLKEKTTSSSPMKDKEINYNFRLRKWEEITEDDKAKWREAYPAIVIEEEISRAGEWLYANPKNRKKNYRRFLTNWFGRSQDRAPRAKGGNDGTGNTKDLSEYEQFARN